MKVFKRFCLFLFSLAVVLACPASVSALTSSQNKFFGQNNIIFYNPDPNDCANYNASAGTLPSGDQITWIGDSYSVGAESSNNLITSTFSGVDLGSGTDNPSSYIQSSKFISGNSSSNPSGFMILQSLISSGKLRPYLVFALGTNTSAHGWTQSELNQLDSYLNGTNTKVILITAYTTVHDYTEGNNLAKTFAEQHSDRYIIADWAAVARPEYYSSDSSGVHPFQHYDKWIGVIKSAFTSGGSSTSSSGSTGNGANYAGDTVWEGDLLNKANEYKTIYQTAGQQYGIPWQLIATMHRLESGMSLTNPSNGQGLFQLYSYTNGGTNSNSFAPGATVNMTEFQRQANLAAEEMKGIIESGGYTANSDDGAKFLLFSYNGRAGQYIQKALAMGFTQRGADIGEGSPYVMNRYDAKRDPNSSEMDSNWPGRFVADGVYDSSSTMSDFGGFVLYTALGGGTGLAGICSDSTSGDLSSYVLKYAWPDYHSAPYHERMPDYAAAVTRRINEGKYVGGTVGGVQGIDCGGFVTTLVNDSGLDPDYNGSGYASAVTQGQLRYIRDHPEKWQLINSSWNTPVSGESQLSPGDIAFSDCSGTSIQNGNCGHTYIYVGEISGFNSHIASASYSTHGSGRAPMAGHEAIVGNNINWFHKVR